MRLTFLGTGTSFGVPQIGCDCSVCRSTDPRDKRTRSGAILETAGSTILIDTPPELRLQLLAGGFSRIDAVVYTHEHADHVNGIDDLRIFSVRQPRPLPIYGPAETLDRVRASFNYIFDDAVRPYEGTSKPRLTLHPTEPGQPVSMAGVEVASTLLSARASPGVRLPVREPGLHHRCESHSGDGVRPAARARCAGTECPLVAAAPDASQHLRGGGAPPRRWARGAPT